VAQGKGPEFKPQYHKKRKLEIAKQNCVLVCVPLRERKKERERERE
jgi:hypothetical protein